MTIFNVKAKVNGTYQNLWSGYTLQEARRVSANHDKNVPFGGDVSWIWDSNNDRIIK